MMKKIFVLFLLNIIGVQLNAQLLIARPICEGKTNPVGIALTGFRFGWELGTKENGQYQTAYHLIVASSPDKFNAGNYDIYNSSVVKGSQSTMVNYNGKRLLPGKNYYWRVRVWDKNNTPSAWSDINQFTTGLFAREDWSNAMWIGYEDLPDSMRVAPGVHAPLVNKLGNKCMQRSVVPLFRKQFSIDKKVKNALLFVTGLGQYELSMNGTKVGNAFLSPGWTYFDKTVLYNCYDVSNQLLKGEDIVRNKQAQNVLLIRVV